MLLRTGIAAQNYCLAVFSHVSTPWVEHWSPLRLALGPSELPPPCLFFLGGLVHPRLSKKKKNVKVVSWRGGAFFCQCTHCRMVSWYHSATGRGCHDSIVQRYLATMLPGHLATVVPWYHGILLPLYHGTKVLRYVV